MGWEFFVIIRILGSTLYTVAIKAVLNRKENLLTAVPFFLVLVPATLYSITGLSLGQLNTLNNHPTFWLGLAGNVGCNSVNYMINMWIIRKYDISYLESMKTSLPIFAGFFGSLFLQEYLSLEIWLCILVIVIGCFLLEFSRKEISDKNTQHPFLKRFLNLMKTSAWVFLIPWLSINAIATVFSKMVVSHGAIELYLGFRYSLLALFFVTLSFILYTYKQKKNPTNTTQAYSFIQSFFTKHHAKAMIAGLGLSIAVFGEMRALKMADIALVETLSKAGLFLILFAEILILKQRLNWLRILAGSIIMGGVFIFFFIT